MSPSAPARPRVRVLIPSWNARQWLPGCLDALRRQSFRDFAVTVVEGGSTDGSTELVREGYPEVDLLELGVNRGFAAAANAGIRATAEPLVALLNADTRPEPGWLEALVAAADSEAPEIGSFASLMLQMDASELVDDAGDQLSRYGSARKRGRGEPATRYDQPEEVLSACAGAALYRRELFARAGLFDEGFESYLEDVDLGLRARHAGFRCRYQPGARVLHAGGGSALPRRRYVVLTTANRALLLIKNLPAGTLARNLHRLLYAQGYFLLVHRRPLASLRGYARLLRRLPRALRERRRILSGTALSPAELDGLLAPELGEPPLRALIARRLASRSAR